MKKNEKAASALSHLFEVSWEVCNKVGGIHTVVATKALTMTRKYGDNYILIGPDIHREGDNPEFEEDTNLLRDWRLQLYAEDGLRVKVGRWKVKGAPIAILIDFTSVFPQKNEVLKFLWESYQVDSISGQWDYIEPVLFGYAAGKVIDRFVESFCSATDNIAAHFHEWMTSSGGLYLQKHSPYVATVFTTHATVMGRSIAGNGLALYSQLENINADELARRFNTVAKHSLEKAAANNYDCFTTVSDITARESKYLLGKEVNIVTPNGFENDFVWPEPEFSKKRKAARAMMIKVAEACLGTKFAKDPVIIGTSGRYEFHNKGIDIFIEALKKVAGQTYKGRQVLAYITVPAGNDGPRKDLQAHLADTNNAIDAGLYKHTTHYLSAPQWDPVVLAMQNSKLLDPESNVKLIFVPCYLNGDDGIFDMPYYELLAGMDATVFPSYYEPWGYTPLESIAFSVPTVTTTLAGFGLWVDQHLKEHKGTEVLMRTDHNDDEMVNDIAASVVRFAGMTAKEYDLHRQSALDISNIALWKNLTTYYDQAYAAALATMTKRTNKLVFEEPGMQSKEQISFVRQQLISNSPNWKSIIVEKKLPERLRPLEILSHNLWWSWTLGAHEVYEYIDQELWRACGKNPIELLDNLNMARLQELENDSVFLGKMDEVFATFNAYMAEKKDAVGPKIGYFSMEYGLHHTLKIYSGGLGILAGDYLKEASDMNVPMVAVGLLYRYGYFKQKISAQGSQEATYEAQNFFKLPVTAMRDDNGNWISVRIAFPGRTVTARIWRCDVGRTELYLLDTDHELNLEEDRSITHHLYGGDWENRLKQEIVLGIGGIRALNELSITQDVFHCNEGHAAFINLERIYNMISNRKLSFSEGLEVVRSSTLFTTHTPVPAGHDAFAESMIRQYMSHYPDRLGITWEQFISLGRTTTDPNERFSMSYLACNLSQEVNGVSWLHGEVSKDILGSMWPGYFKDELHIGYVTNGVHFPSWTAGSMRRLYSKYFKDGFSGKHYDIPAWQKVHEIADRELWDQRMHLKNKLVHLIRERIADPSQIRYDSPNQLVKIREVFRAETLTIGFARRFATYKRAHLLFTNLERLDRIVNNPQRPVQFVFAGKAHPNDKPGQELIKRIVEVSVMPQFVGKIIFLQNYDIELARKMVQGVDVWLNTPTRPLEASGTSGEKCVMNGVMQFSVLDGWWVEGYKEGAGWMLPMEQTFADNNYQNEMDAEMIYGTIEQQIVPLYYDNRNAENVPTGWMESVKKCVADIASNFTTNRMLNDYCERFYNKLYERKKQLKASDYTMARSIASWKRRVSAGWDGVKVIEVKQMTSDNKSFVFGNSYDVEVIVDLGALSPEDVGVELLVATRKQPGDNIKLQGKFALEYASSEGAIATYHTTAIPGNTGYFDLAVRVYPKNALLPHRMDFALVKWA